MSFVLNTFRMNQSSSGTRFINENNSGISENAEQTKPEKPNTRPTCTLRSRESSNCSTLNPSSTNPAAQQGRNTQTHLASSPDGRASWNSCTFLMVVSELRVSSDGQRVTAAARSSLAVVSDCCDGGVVNGKGVARTEGAGTVRGRRGGGKNDRDIDNQKHLQVNTAEQHRGERDGAAHSRRKGSLSRSRHSYKESEDGARWVRLVLLSYKTRASHFADGKQTFRWTLGVISSEQPPAISICGAASHRLKRSHKSLSEIHLLASR